METIFLCIKCSKKSDFSNFINNKICIECFETSSLDYKICKDCKCNKQLKDYYKNSISKDGRFNSCCECVKLKKRNGKEKTITPDNNCCEDFFKYSIIKTGDLNDKIVITKLYKEYKKYLCIKNYKCNIIQQIFKNIMLNPKFLGEQFNNCWRGFKIKS